MDAETKVAYPREPIEVMVISDGDRMCVRCSIVKDGEDGEWVVRRRLQIRKVVPAAKTTRASPPTTMPTKRPIGILFFEEEAVALLMSGCPR